MFRSSLETAPLARGFTLMASLLLVLCASLLLAPAPLLAATEESTAQAHAPATVRYYNRDILTFRSAFMGRSPLQRAQVAEFNIKRIVDEPGTPGVTFNDTAAGVILLLGGEVVTLITPADVDTAQGQSLAQVREEVRSRLGEAVAAAERERAPGRVLRGVLHSLVATALAAALAWVMAWLARQLRAAMLVWVGKKPGRCVACRYGRCCMGPMRWPTGCRAPCCWWRCWCWPRNGCAMYSISSTTPSRGQRR